MKTHDFWYDLPEELIAQTPLERRDSSRLLVLDRRDRRRWSTGIFMISSTILNPGDCLVMNDSRVLPARLLGQRPTGGGCGGPAAAAIWEDGAWECLVKPGPENAAGPRRSASEMEPSPPTVTAGAGGRKPAGAVSIMREFFWRFWSAWVKCPCRRTSRRSSRTRSATRRCTPGPWAPQRPPQRDCTSPGSCWSRIQAEGSQRGLLCHPPCGSGHLPAGEGGGDRRTTICTASCCMLSRRRRT